MVPLATTTVYPINRFDRDVWGDGLWKQHGSTNDEDSPEHGNWILTAPCVGIILAW
jgi:hypothetical protein